MPSRGQTASKVYNKIFLALISLASTILCQSSNTVKMCGKLARAHASKREKKCGRWQENKQCNPLAATCRELCGAAFQEGLSEKLHPKSSVTASLLILYCTVLPYVGTSVHLKCNMFPKKPTRAWFSPCFSYVGCHLHSPDHRTTVQSIAVS